MSTQSSQSNSETLNTDNVQQISDAAKSAANAAGREAKSLLGDAMVGLKQTARFTWHTYLGAIITAEEFAVNTTKSFARRGSDFEGQAKEKIAKQVKKANKSTENLRKQARQRIAEVENFIERGTDRSLHMLRVPTRGDMDQLTSLIEDLADSVNELAEKSGSPSSKANHSRSKKATNSAAASAPA